MTVGVRKVVSFPESVGIFMPLFVMCIIAFLVFLYGQIGFSIACVATGTFGSTIPLGLKAYELQAAKKLPPL